MSNDSETFFIRFLMIDTTSDQDLRSIAQKLSPTAPLSPRAAMRASRAIKFAENRTKNFKTHFWNFVFNVYVLFFA